MPVLNYHKVIKDMPDLNKLQKCDICGAEKIGKRMHYSYPINKTYVICKKCFTKITKHVL